MIPGQVQCPFCLGWDFPALKRKHDGCMAKFGSSRAVVHALKGSSRVVHAEKAPGGVSEAAEVKKGTRHGKYSDPEKRRQYRAEWARKARARKAQERGDAR